MSRLKALGAVTGITLLVLAAALIYVAGRNLLELRPADSYQDAGVHIFVAYRVLPSQVPNTGASGRDRRMNPTKTIYKVHYLATDGSGYQWSEQVLTESIGQDMVDAETTVERRVLRIPADHTYIVVSTDQTAESYTDGLRERYVRILIPAAAYILLYSVIQFVLRVWRHKRVD